MAAFSSNIDITSGGTYAMDVTNGETSSKVATDLNGKFANIQELLRNGLPEVWTGSSLPDSLPNGKILNYNNTLYYGVSKTQIGTYSQIQSVSSIANNALNIANNANANANTKVQMQIVSYVGTGVFGADNPCSIKANFPIKVAIMAGTTDRGSRAQWMNFFSHTYIALLCTDSMSTDFAKGYGFGEHNGDNHYPMGKVSSDKKTLTWYSNGLTSEADTQFNKRNYTYYVILLG